MGDWFVGELGPGWVQVDQGPGYATWRRHTTYSDGSYDDETATWYDDFDNGPSGNDISQFVKTHVTELPDPNHPGNTEVTADTTYTRHDTDGKVLGVSSSVTTEYLDRPSGRTWTTTTTDEQGGSAVQRGTTYDGPRGGTENVTTTRSNGTTRVDSVMWNDPSEGTRLTTEKDADGTITSTISDDVIRNDDGNWEYHPTDGDDGDAGDNPANIPDGGDEGGDEGEGPEGGIGGDFGPGGPDAGASSIGDGDDGDDGDDGEVEGGDGDEPHVPGPIINPPLD